MHETQHECPGNSPTDSVDNRTLWALSIDATSGSTPELQQNGNAERLLAYSLQPRDLVEVTFKIDPTDDS